jgi:hypothetical protein
MTASAQSALVYALARIGLAKTLLATKGRNGYCVHRLEQRTGRWTLLKIGELTASGAPVIGRVSRPLASLPLVWRESLTFYGRWYDELAPADPSGALRVKIAQLPLATLLTQIQRDERYGLVGTYYAIFQAIMTGKQRIPLILLDTESRDDASLPVILPASAGDRAHHEMESVLRLMLSIDAQRAVVHDGVRSSPPAVRRHETSPPV